MSQSNGFDALLYRLGILVTLGEQKQLRSLSIRDRALEQSIPQLLVALPLVLLLGPLCNGWVGLPSATVSAAVVLVGLYLIQSSNAHDGPPGKRDQQ